MTYRESDRQMVWQDAYDQARVEGASEATASLYADSVLIDWSAQRVEAAEHQLEMSL